MALLQLNWRDTGKEYYQLNMYDLPGTYYYPAHIHQNQTELVYCSRGEFIHRINGVNYRHKTGELRLIGEKDIHLLRGENFSYFNLAFASSWLEKLAAFMGREGETLFDLEPGGLVPLDDGFRDSLDDTLDTLFRWEDTSRAPVPFTRFMTSLLEKILPAGVHPESAGEQMPDWLEAALKVLHDTLSLEESREASCRSREHFSRSFKKHLGMSPVNYLNRIRIESASRLLIRTNLTIQTISLRCGYKNQNYFNRCFRHIKDMTPMEYRKRFANRVH